MQTAKGSRPKSHRPSSAIWSQLSNPLPQNRRNTTSFVSSSGTFSLEDSLFEVKGKRHWSWTQIKRRYKRQPRVTRIVIAVSGGLACLYIIFNIFFGRPHGKGISFDSTNLDNDKKDKNNNNNNKNNHYFEDNHLNPAGSYSRAGRAKNIVCNPFITQDIPAAPPQPLSESKTTLSNGTHEFDPTVIVLSFDGLRADYLKRGLTPTLLSVGEQGVKAEFMQPSFPTLTFPNHYTMCTGLYPSSHGIVANMFYDPALNDDFNYRIPEKSWDPKWWGGEPIWETAVRQNQKSGVIMWPGGEAMRSVPPTYHVRHKSSTPVQAKMDTLLEWLDKPKEERPTVMTVYISEVDTAGHYFGPDSKRLQKALTQVDTALASLLDGLRSRNLDKIINLMLVSDHGMSYVTAATSIYYDDYIDPSELILEESLQPHLGIQTKDPKRLLEIYQTLKDAQFKHNLPFKVYKREDIPARYHYASNPRIAPVVVLADPGHVMTRRDMDVAVVGVHGWDNEMEEMRAIFIASGPAFPNQGPQPLPPIENVELYEIIARTAGLVIKDGATDGVRQGWVSRPCRSH
ncbi:hypothetical protein BG004_000560 [Podila humilis]|nr:hypothetical protein BG004_000560 [Podila humilis]